MSPDGSFLASAEARSSVRTWPGPPCRIKTEYLHETDASCAHVTLFLCIHWNTPKQALLWARRKGLERVSGLALENSAASWAENSAIRVYDALFRFKNPFAVDGAKRNLYVRDKLNRHNLHHVGYAFPALAFAMPRLIAARWAADNFLPRSLLTRAVTDLLPFVLNALIAARIRDSFDSTLPDTTSSLPSSFRSTFRTSIPILQLRQPLFG